ncbi:hypothetical protein [Variovorax sp. RA8]|nr:hypothetical protein [Variovorax sp. RA8]
MSSSEGLALDDRLHQRLCARAQSAIAAASATAPAATRRASLPRLSIHKA